MSISKLFKASLISISLIPSFLTAEVLNDISEAFKNGKPKVSFRLRHENAKEDNLKTGKATTLRSLVAYETAEFNDFKINLELIDVSNFFGQRYNPDVSDLRKPAYAKIRDPKGTGLSQGYFKFSGIESTDITLGRQYIKLDDERFFSNVDFRQFPQSFDGLTIKNSLCDNLDIFYGFVHHVNTINGNSRTTDGRRKLRTHIINIGWEGFQYGKLTGFAYFNKDYSIREFSNVTTGIRASSTDEFKELCGFGYSASFARQQSRYNNPTKYNAYYGQGEISKTIDALTAYLGFELLSGDSTNSGKSFQTPHGDTHKFLGYADAIEITPDRGLLDLYSKFTGDLGQVKPYFSYHYFRLRNGTGSKRAGQELDLGVKLEVNDNISFSSFYARYNEKNRAVTNIPKIRRFWVSASASFL